MNNRDLPPVPALGDPAMVRIERGVFAALDRVGHDARFQDRLPAPRPSHRWRYALGLAGVAIVVLAVVGARQLRRGTGLPARGARIATASSPSHITIPGASIDVAPGSAIDFATENDDTVVIVLERGAITCEVAPRSRRAPFVVEAGATRATVIGTRFTVVRTGDHARVSVEHGTVEVGDDGITQLVYAGQSFRPAETPGSAPANARATIAQSEVTSPVVASTESTASTASHEVAPLRRRRAADALTLAARSSKVPPTQRAPDLAPIAAANSQPPEGRSLHGDAWQQRFETAAGLEVLDPSQALQIYQELAADDGAWGANALFAQARLEAERGHEARSRVLLDGYLQRFPRGPNANDARTLLAKLGRGNDASAR